VTVADALMLALGLIALGSGAFVVTSSHLVRAGFYLVVSLGAIAGLYLVMGAELVAWVQVLVYVGAVVVLLLFALMLTKAPTGRQEELTARRVVPAAVVATLVGVLLAVTVVAGFRDVRLDLDRAVVGSAETTGTSVFTLWVLPFEVLSVLLLAALVGAIALSRLRAGDD
jgi:NADH:ubiquinone oxidoreductase subunit 6 (subunit J)